MSQKMYLKILQIGVYVSLFFVFFVFKNLLFPYITSKQIPFNILMEVLFIILVAFVVKYPQYRPKKSYITFGMMAFFSIMIISSFTGVDYNLSMFGDVERMLGAFHILHFFILYLVIITAFKSWTDWKWLYVTSLVIAVLVSLNGLGEGAQAYSYIGNTAYVSGYLIFNIYFTILLFIKEKKDNSLRWLYLLPNLIFYFEFVKLQTTGALVGLGVSFMLMAFLYGVMYKNKKIRIATFSILVFLIALTAFVFLNRNSDFVKNTPPFSNISAISTQKATFQTRLISWRGGIKDLRNHPFLGVGHGNYAYIFDKYFDPAFYDITRGDTYFDRAHNNIIDIVSTTGFLGLLTYLSIFVALAYYLIRGYRKDYIDLHEFIILTSLFVGYFIQNLAVFDSFPTYQMLMISLGYVYWLNKKGEDVENGVSDIDGGDTTFDNKEIYALLISGIIMLTIAYQYNVKPWKMLVGTIDGQKVAKNPELLIAAYKKALSYDTVLDRDSRTSLIRMFSDPNSLTGLTVEKKKEYMDYIISLAEKNVAYNTHDSLNQMALAQVLNTAASIYQIGSESFMFYSSRALEAINKSIEATPGRVPVYYQKAQVYMTQGETDKALETLRYAYDLHPSYYDSSCYLGKTLIYLKKETEGYRYLDECVQSAGGADLLSPVGYVRSLVKRYVDKNDWESVEKLAKRIVTLEPTSANWINLAKLYVQRGEKDKAIEAVGAAVKLDPGIEQYAKEFLDNLK